MSPVCRRDVHDNWLSRTVRRRRRGRPGEPRIGLALGGGFARGIAHVGILRVLEREGIPLHCVTGVSAGAIVAAAFASGATSEEIGRVGSAMRFGDVARWSLCRLGLVGSERMTKFLGRLLKQMRFEDMKIPLGIVATDVMKGEPVLFRQAGDLSLAIRASCSYPGLFRPVEMDGRILVDGAISVEVPALLARRMGATHVISVCIPSPTEASQPHNMFEVINRCFQIMMSRTEESWRRHSDLVIMPEVADIAWDGFGNAQRMIDAGEEAAARAVQQIREWSPAPAESTCSMIAPGRLAEA
jgi:NTE family protein